MDLNVFETLTFEFLVGVPAPEQPFVTATFVNKVIIANEAANNTIEIGNASLALDTGLSIEAGQQVTIEAPIKNGNQGLIDLSALRVIGTVGQLVRFGYVKPEL